MTITINHHHYLHIAGDDTLKSIFSQLKQIKMDVTELVAKVDAQGVQLDKVFTEVTAVKQALADALAAGQTVPQALVDAINGVGVKIQAVDDLNADAV